MPAREFVGPNFSNWDMELIVEPLLCRFRPSPLVLADVSCGEIAAKLQMTKRAREVCLPISVSLRDVGGSTSQCPLDPEVICTCTTESHSVFLCLSVVSLAVQQQIRLALQRGRPDETCFLFFSSIGAH